MSNYYQVIIVQKRNNTESGIIDRIPRFKCGENGWMDESTVLLLDNNVTTFKTLSTSKSYLQKRGIKFIVQ